ncbi:MAG: hypothetical protein LQ343_006367 [Gyalolechia ehrenbergii]|nr:MAG: hypothetical protein LQ343_006367 [Gyalolechia ehrenbergii]
MGPSRERTPGVASPEETSHPIPDSGSTTSAPAQGQSLALRSNGIAQTPQGQRRYEPPAVDPSRVVQKPVSRFQNDSPREFQIRQLDRRFSSLQKKSGNGETTLSFQLEPSDPDFPFELNGLDCVLHVPDSYPQNGRPFLAVKNKDMPRGYQINVERGFDALVQRSPQATLLSLMNALDKQLEVLLTEQKAETIKIMPNISRTAVQQPVDAGHTTACVVVPRAIQPPRKEQLRFNLQQRQNAQVQRMTLMAHVNYLAQHMHEMATEPEIEPEEPAESAVPVDNLRIEGDEVEVPNQRFTELEDDRSHIKIVPRPPEWTTHGNEESDSDSTFSDSYDSGDEFEEEHEEHLHDHTPESTQGAPSIQPAGRGISLSFPSLELYNIELLELTSLSLSVKCTRCKTSSDIHNIRTSNPRSASCSKCVQPFSLNYRSELVHSNSYRAGYVDLTGCTVADMLPSTFIPTCSTCSTSVPSSSGVVSVRGDAASIAICRECHTRLTFKIPETKFMLVSDNSLHPRNLLPLRRKKLPKENLGIVTGQELPRQGRCRHYMKSYRWFRFSCCAKVYACDKCHDEGEQHPNEHANRMICGFCAREQNYRPEDCAVCRKVVVGKRGSGFWEGGKGTRDKSRMSRKDPRKYKRRPGTRVGGPNKGGIGGGGESAKKT